MAERTGHHVILSIDGDSIKVIGWGNTEVLPANINGKTLLSHVQVGSPIVIIIQFGVDGLAPSMCKLESHPVANWIMIPRA